MRCNHRPPRRRLRRPARVERQGCCRNWSRSRRKASLPGSKATACSIARRASLRSPLRRQAWLRRNQYSRAGSNSTAFCASRLASGELLSHLQIELRQCGVTAALMRGQLNHLAIGGLRLVVVSQPAIGKGDTELGGELPRCPLTRVRQRRQSFVPASLLLVQIGQHEQPRGAIRRQLPGAATASRPPARRHARCRPGRRRRRCPPRSREAAPRRPWSSTPAGAADPCEIAAPETSRGTPRLRLLPKLGTSRRQAMVGRRIVGTHPHAVFQISPRLVILVQLEVCLTEQRCRRARQRVGLQDLLQHPDGFLRLALVDQDFPEIHRVRGRGGILLHGAAVVFRSRLEVPCVESRRGDCRMRGRVWLGSSSIERCQQRMASLLLRNR